MTAPLNIKHVQEEAKQIYDRWIEFEGKRALIAPRAKNSILLEVEILKVRYDDWKTVVLLKLRNINTGEKFWMYARDWMIVQVLGEEGD